MFALLADADAKETLVFPVTDLNGVTSALVAFILVCVIFPKMVKNRPQFYCGLACVVGIILLHTLSLMILSVATFAAAMGGLLQIGALVLLFVSAGGLTFKDLAGELGNAYEVIRRGGEKKEVIIPLTGAMPKPRQQSRAIDPQSPGRITIDDPESSGQVPLE